MTTYSRRHQQHSSSPSPEARSPESNRLLATSAPKANTDLGANEGAVRKTVMTAGITWLFELCIGHYIEFLKIQKQTKPGTYVELTKAMVAKKGIGGILDGYFPWGSLQAVAKGGSFSFGHNIAKKQLQHFIEKGQLGKQTAEIMAGGLGGAFQGVVMSPVLLLKTRVMTDEAFRGSMNTWQTAKLSTVIGARVVSQEGLSGLMKGSLVFSAKRVADWTTRFFFAESAKKYLFQRGDTSKKLSMTQELAASLIGGSLSALATLPIDVMVAQIQQASKAGVKVSVFQTFSDEFKEGGWNRVAGFATRGLLARIAHVALTTMIMKTGASYAYEMVYGKPMPKGH